MSEAASERFLGLCEEYPALKALYEEIRAVPPTEPFCSNAVWFGYDDVRAGYKTRFKDLLGEHPELGNRYDLIYGGLYNALPWCRTSDGRRACEGC